MESSIIFWHIFKQSLIRTLETVSLKEDAKAEQIKLKNRYRGRFKKIGNPEMRNF